MTENQKKLETLLLKEIEQQVGHCEERVTIPQVAMALLRLWEITEKSNNNSESAESLVRRIKENIAPDEEINTIYLDFEKGLLEINGKKITEPMIVIVPDIDNWPKSRVINYNGKSEPDKGEVLLPLTKKLEVRLYDVDSEKSTSQ